MKTLFDQKISFFEMKVSLLFFLFLFHLNFAQKDSLQSDAKTKGSPVKIKQFIVPAVLVTAGFVSLANPKLNESIKKSLQKSNPNFKTSIDNYTQFIPGAAVFALNAFGIKGKHNWKDEALIYGTSIAMATAFVIPLKALPKEECPDFSANNSFPSGHTAIAFASAEFLR